MTSITPAEVTVVSVTYGLRFPLVQLCVQSLANVGVLRLVLVTNGIAETYRSQLESLRDHSELNIELVHLPENVGAGQGFAAGLRRAVELYGETFIWLMDDDNCPRSNGWAALQEAARNLDLIGDVVALAGLRGERFPTFMAAARSGEGNSVFYRKSSLFTLDIRSIPTWGLRKAARFWKSNSVKVDESKGVPARIVSIPGSPFGGFFINGRHISTIGYPDPRYVLYFDDLEWTNRVCRCGGTIFLVPNCRIDDAEPDWSGAGGSRFFLIDLIASDNRVRVFYTVRNCVYFKSRYWRDSWAILLLNVGLLIGLSAGIGLMLRKPAMAAVVVRAAIDGLLGRLGGRL